MYGVAVFILDPEGNSTTFDIDYSDRLRGTDSVYVYTGSEAINIKTGERLRQHRIYPPPKPPNNKNTQPKAE